MAENNGNHTAYFDEVVPNKYLSLFVPFLQHFSFTFLPQK